MNKNTQDCIHDANEFGTFDNVSGVCWVCGKTASQVTDAGTAPREQMEALFAPDIRVKLDEDSRITSVEAITKLGASFILKNETLGRNYDDVLFASEGLCFEQT